MAVPVVAVLAVLAFRHPLAVIGVSAGLLAFLLGMARPCPRCYRLTSLRERAAWILCPGGAGGLHECTGCGAKLRLDGGEWTPVPEAEWCITVASMERPRR